MWVIISIIILSCFSVEVKSAELKLLYPLQTDSLEIGSQINIKWENSSSKPINVLYSLDSLNWLPIVTNTTLTNYNWIVPQTFKSKVYFKLTRNGDTGVELIWDNKNAHTDWTQVAKFVGNDKIVSVGKEDSIKVWQISSKKLLRTLFIQNSPTNIQATNFAMEYDKDKLLVAQDKAIWTWDLQTDQKKRIYVNPKLIIAKVLDYDPNNREIAVSSDDGFVEIIDLFGKLTARFYFTKLKTISTLDYSSDGKFLAVAGDDGYLYVVNLETEEIKKSSYHHGAGENIDFKIWSVQISEDNKYIVSGGVDNKAVLWDFKTLDTIITYNYSSDIRATKFNSISDRFLVAGLNSKIEQYSISSMSNGGLTINHGSHILWAEYLNKGDTLLSAARDGSFKVWKNSNSADVVEVSSAIVYQNLKISFPEIKVQLGETFDIPIDFKGNFSILDSIKIKYSLPIDLINIKNFANNKQSVQADLELTNTFVKDKLIPQTLYTATSLLSYRKKGDLKIIEIEYFPNGNYKVETDDGSVEIMDSCIVDSSRFVSLENKSTVVEIKNQVVNNTLTYLLTSIIDAKYKFEIYDAIGNLKMELYDKFLHFGNYSFTNDISSLPEGTYFLVTKYEDKILSSQFLKLNK
ncbi:MAG TPA: hypothetical protein PLE30_10040 [Candidatus Kapabacteria bacterium]|nr:hypothetical protein [Candidatus Kapabacteria bacterium]